MGKSKVLLLGPVFHAHEAWDKLAQEAEVLTPKSTTREDFIKESRAGGFEGAVAMYRGPKTVAGKFDAEMVDAFPKSLRFICYAGAGYDSVDVSACTAASIQVSNVRVAVDDPTADTTLFLLLGAIRMYNPHILSLRAGGWEADCPMGKNPQGMVLGILGMGGIGKAVARRAHAMGMNVQYHNRSKSADADPAITYLSFDKLLETSDAITLCLPLNDKTYHIISKPEFDKMKPGVTIVNTARGKVMDEQALVDALESGKVWSAGLDVFENEPKVHPKLLKNERVLLLPHVGTFTSDSRRSMEEWAISNLKSALDTGKLKNRVPEQVDIAF